MARSRTRFFSPDALKFLSGLALNNNREWFEANREAYEALVREPARAFIRELAPRLARISSELVASDKKVGGSLMRVHRDVRFSRDKSPYKTNIGVQFRHSAGKDVHAPGYYVHIAPDECFFGCGVWHPDAKSLGRMRQYIDQHRAQWKKVVGAKKFGPRYSRMTESLSRAPQGYPVDHPLIGDLKLKNHVAMLPLRNKDVTSGDFPQLVTEHCRATRDYMAFLCAALGLDF